MIRRLSGQDASGSTLIDLHGTGYGALTLTGPAPIGSSELPLFAGEAFRIFLCNKNSFLI